MKKIIKNPYKIKMLMLVMTLFTLTFATGYVWYSHGDKVLTEDNVMYMVSHTEYRYGEPGQIITRLVDFQDNAVAVTSCNATILYPNKTVMVDMAPMLDTGAITGDHYYTFTTPNGPEGTYEYQATCFYGSSKTKTATNSFHLSSAFTTIEDLVANTNLSISSSISSFRQEVQANFSNVLDVLSVMNSTLGNLSLDLTPVTTRLDYMNATQTAMQTTLNNVNATTSNTYTYMTGTLATNVNSVLSTLGIINATVNRIESNTLQINTTTSQILANQEAEVYMSVYSG